MTNEKMNTLVKKYKALDQKITEASVELDKDILKVRAKLQELEAKKREATKKYVEKQESIMEKVTDFMKDYEEKSYDAGIGKVVTRVYHSVVCEDEAKTIKRLKSTEFVRTKYVLDKTKIKNEMTSKQMAKAGIEIKESKSVTIK